MSADGSVIFEIRADDKKAQQELNRLNRKIQTLNDQIYVKQRQRMPLVEQSDQLVAQLDEAKAKLDAMQSGQKGTYSTEAITAQQETVRALEAEWSRVQRQVESYDSQIKKANISIDLAKEQAGELQQQMATAGPNSEAMANAVNRMEKGMDRFSNRLREVVRSALVFTVISQGLASLREWMGKVIRTNDEATAAIARLKGALLTLVQPLVNVIIPAFTTFVNVLARIVSMVSRFVAKIFGTTAENAANAAENLYEETEALEGVGAAAEEAAGSLASFDEINTISSSSNAGASGGGGSEGSIQPDFKQLVVDGLTAIVELFTGVFLLAIGAILTFTGANIPIGLALMALGALAIVDAITSNPDAIKQMLQAGLGAALEAIGPLIAVIGVLLVVTGHILIGISLILVGAALWAVGAASGDEGDFIENILTRLAEAATVIGPMIAVLGVFLIVTGHILLGLGFVIAGAALWAAGKAAGDEGDFVQIILARLQEAASIIGPLIAVIGIILLVAGQIATGIGLIIAGIAIWTFSEINLDGGDGIANEILSALLNVFAKIGPYIALIGVILLFTPLPKFKGIGIGMIVAGIALFAVGEIGMNWTLLSSDLVQGLLNILHDISPYIALLGIILLCVPGMQAIGIGMIVTGIALFAISSIVPNWDFLKEKVKEIFDNLFQWWDANVAEYLTIEYWKGVGSDIIDGFLGGVKKAWETVSSWVESVVGWFKGMFSDASDSVSNVKNNNKALKARAYDINQSVRMSAPRLSVEDIPALARGTVVPPNREFLARLGDNKQETEVVSPLSTMKQAMLEALQEAGGFGNGTIEVKLMLDGKQLARNQVKHINQMTQQAGKPVLLI